MPQLQTAIVGHNNTQAQVTGQNELLVKVNSISVTAFANTLGAPRTPKLARVTSAFTNLDPVFSFSVANVGAGNGTVLGATIKPGEIVNYDASSMNNFFAAGAITASGAGTELLISWITAK
jgi:hypothetical protein